MMRSDPAGRCKAPGFFTDPRIRAAWCKAEWLGPVQGQLDPTKEVKADILAVAHGFKTHEQVLVFYKSLPKFNPQGICIHNESANASTLFIPLDTHGVYVLSAGSEVFKFKY